MGLDIRLNSDEWSVGQIFVSVNWHLLQLRIRLLDLQVMEMDDDYNSCTKE